MHRKSGRFEEFLMSVGVAVVGTLMFVIAVVFVWPVLLAIPSYRQVLRHI